MKKATLIAGPTASGKSSLALALAKRYDGVIINADALQVYDIWRVLSARPDDGDLAQAPHALYGFVPFDDAYSAGKWLKEISELLDTIDKYPIIIGGTGLYFRALTEGLAEIPPTPPELRAHGNEMMRIHGIDWFKKKLLALDNKSFKNVDMQNPARVQRAWEVRIATGKSLWQWHQETPPPVLDLEDCQTVVLNWQPDDLNARIGQRFDWMMQNGAIDEVRHAVDIGYDPALPSGKALGASEIAAALRNEISFDEAAELAKIATRQFAKRQRTWFRSRMKSWKWFNMTPETKLENILMNLDT